MCTRHDTKEGSPLQWWVGVAIVSSAGGGGTEQQRENNNFVTIANTIGMYICGGSVYMDESIKSR